MVMDGMQTMEHLQMYDAAGCELFLQTLRLMRLEMKKRYKQVGQQGSLFPLPVRHDFLPNHLCYYFLFVKHDKHKTNNTNNNNLGVSWIPHYWIIWVR